MNMNSVEWHLIIGLKRQVHAGAEIKPVTVLFLSSICRLVMVHGIYLFSSMHTIIQFGFAACLCCLYCSDINKINCSSVKFLIDLNCIKLLRSTWTSNI